MEKPKSGLHFPVTSVKDAGQPSGAQIITDRDKDMAKIPYVDSCGSLNSNDVADVQVAGNQTIIEKVGFASSNESVNSQRQNSPEKNETKQKEPESLLTKQKSGGIMRWGAKMMQGISHTVDKKVNIGFINERTYMMKNKEGHIEVNDLIRNENDKYRNQRGGSLGPKKPSSPSSFSPQGRRARKFIYKQDRQALPQFMLEAQIVACKCEICKKALNVLRSTGIDPKIKDIEDQNKRQLEFLKIQASCNEKMQRINSSKGNEGYEENLMDSIRDEMERLKQLQGMEWTQGDYFKFEEHNYNWLLEKLATPSVARYHGCEINIPETLIFEGGNMKKIVKTTDNGFVQQVRGPLSLQAQLATTQIKTHLDNIARERTRNTAKKYQQLKHERAAAIKRKAAHDQKKKQIEAQQSRQGGMATTMGATTMGGTTSMSGFGGTMGTGGMTATQGTISLQAEEDEEEIDELPEGLGAVRGKIDTQKAQDCFLIRFDPQSDRRDRVIAASNFELQSVIMEHRANDNFWKELMGISLTPVAKRGLGKHFTFDFVAPCYETVKYGDDQKKVTSFYGDVTFDYNQFGKNDNMLVRKAPIHYCLKMCHKLGYYLQKLFKLDIMRVKVDFYMDQFNKIWLLETKDLYIRSRRKVPTEGNTLLADYIMRKMYEIEKHKKDLERAREAEIEQASQLELSRQTPQLTDQNLGQNGDETSDKGFFIHTHPHYFNGQAETENKNKQLKALQLSFLEGSSAQYENLPASESRNFVQEPFVPNRSSYLKPGDDLHDFNKKKEHRRAIQQVRLGLIRKSLNDQRMPSRQSIQKVRDPDTASFRKSCLSANPNNYNLWATNQPGSAHAVGDDMDFFKSTACNSLGKSRLGSTSIMQSDYEAQMQGHDINSLKQLLNDSVKLPSDCHQHGQEQNFQALLALKTKCPLIRKQAVINQVKRAAFNLKHHRKSVATSNNRFTGSKLSVHDTGKRRQSTNATNSSIMMNGKKEDQDDYKQENPFQSGLALERFEKRMAPEEYKDHGLKQETYLPLEAQMMQCNRDEVQFDDIYHQLHEQGNDWKMKIDALASEIDDNPDKPVWTVNKYKEDNSQNIIEMRKKRLEHLNEYNTKVLKQQAWEEEQAALPVHLRSASSGSELGSPQLRKKIKVPITNDKEKEHNSIKNGSMKHSSIQSIRNTKMRGSMEPHQKKTMVSNKKKLMIQLMNEFRERDCVSGPHINPITAPLSQIETDYQPEEIQIQQDQPRFMQTTDETPVALHSHSPVMQMPQQVISPYTVQNAQAPTAIQKYGIRSHKNSEPASRRQFTPSGNRSVVMQRGQMNQSHQNWVVRYKMEKYRDQAQNRKSAARFTGRRQLYFSTGQDAMEAQQFKSTENIRPSQNRTTKNAYFKNRNSVNIQKVNSDSNAEFSQENTLAHLIKIKNRESVGSTTHWGGVQTHLSGYDSNKQDTESNAQASSQNAITKFGEMTGGLSFSNQFAGKEPRQKTPYQGKRPRPEKIDTCPDNFRHGNRTVIGLQIEQKQNKGPPDININHVKPYENLVDDI